MRAQPVALVAVPAAVLLRELAHDREGLIDGFIHDGDRERAS